MVKFVYGAIRIGERIRNNIYQLTRHPTYLYAMSGEVFPSVLKGLLWGSISLRKGAQFSFVVRKDMRIMKDI